MKNIIQLLFVTLTAVLFLSGCGSVLHNGTVMALEEVTITGLPANPYGEGQTMVFSYNKGNEWIHDTDDLDNPVYQADVTADGSLTFTFAPPLEITTATLTFLLIDPDLTWASLKIDKKHSGLSGGDIELENSWGGLASPETIVGTVDGDDVEWEYQE
ncbi:MAG: hypothetical protein JXR86_16350 [Spirochaetales bacterium]|nr:hypothetical protein [Spirochaetales bacterium]